MLKSLIIIGHLIGIFFLTFLFTDEITITDTFPESLTVGENYTVTTSITKNDVSGFAKYQIEAPKGIVIKPIDLNGASFTFKDGKAKFIWMNLPTEPSFDISYQITLENGQLGSQKEVNSRFSYLVENERKIYEGPNHVLNITGEETAATNSVSSGSSDISASRKIVAEGDNKFLVEIDINKLGVKGFAKIQDVIPDGFTASEVMNSGAIFTQTDSKVKLVWFDIPKSMNMQVSYLIEAPADFKGQATIAGKFHYMAGSDLKKVDVPSQTVTIGAEMVADDNAEMNNNNDINDATNNTVQDNVNDKMDEVVDNTNDALNVNDQNVMDEVASTIDETKTSTTESINDVVESGEQKTDEIMSNNNVGNNASDVVNNTANDVTDNMSESNNSSTSNDDETINFMDSFVKNQSAQTDDETDGNSVDEGAIVMDNTDMNNSGIDASNKNTSSSENVSTNNFTDNDIKSNSNAETKSNEVLIPIPTADMTSNIAEPESTAVATDEYVKDEVIKEESDFSSLTNVTAADKGINYRVQIMAGKNVVGKEYLRKKHSFYSDFIIENHEGWIKYTSGSYGTYKTARDQRNMIRDQYNFNGPFVSAYNDGVRITVQEALMITKQQWYN